MKFWGLILLLALVACSAPASNTPSTIVSTPTVVELSSCETTDTAPLDQYRSDDSSKMTLEDNKPKLVEFFARQCPTCDAIRPIVHGLEAQYGNCVDFVYYDSDLEEPGTSALKTLLGYKSPPHFFLLNKNGTIIWTRLGSLTKTELETQLQDILKH